MGMQTIIAKIIESEADEEITKSRMRIPYFFCSEGIKLLSDSDIPRTENVDVTRIIPTRVVMTPISSGLKFLDAKIQKIVPPIAPSAEFNTISPESERGPR